MKKTIYVYCSLESFSKHEVVLVPNVYCSNDYMYFVPPLEVAKTIYQAEKERNEWIRKYDNVLRGLQYWKNKALEGIDKE